MRKNYNFYSFFLIPVLTLLLTAGYGLTETNLSVIGNGGGRRGLFLLWGFLSGNYFFLYTEELLEYSGCRDRLALSFLRLSFLCFLCGIGIPYLPQTVPLLSRIHVYAAFGGSTLLFMTLYRFARTLEKTYGCRQRDLKLMLLFPGVLSFFLLWKVGMISSLLEICLIFSVCILLPLFQRKIEKIRLSNY